MHRANKTEPAIHRRSLALMEAVGICRAERSFLSCKFSERHESDGSFEAALSQLVSSQVSEAVDP